MPNAKAKFWPRNDADVAALLKLREEVARAVVSILRGRRLDSDTTQAQMGYALGVTDDVVSNMEVLKRPIPLEDAILWALLTGAQLPEFLEELDFKLRKILPPK